MGMRWVAPMARPQYQLLASPTMSGCKSPHIFGEGTGSNSMAWVKMFKKPGGGLKKSYQPGSMLSLALTKGLLNEPGQNSCFLNSAVQVLWQLDIFRRSLRQLPGHFCLGDACIFCALKSIFSQFQQSRERALPSDSLRNALAETFKDEQRFQLGLMDDAAECFENILERIHLHIVSDTATDACSSKSCITHQKFAMTLYEQFVCRSCGASSDPHPFTELVHYVSTTALCQQVDRTTGKNERLRSDMFGELLQAANAIGDPRRCPSNCGQSIKIRRVLMNCPEIVTIGFVWDAEQSDLTDDVIRSLGPRLNLSGLFNRVTDENAKRSELHLVGMICFSIKHYSAFAYHTKSSKWMFFDDATVKEIGSKWKDVASKCIRGHFQPLLLFYTNPEGTPVSSEDAPKQTTLCSRYKAQVNGEVTVTTSSKKLDPGRENAGPHGANHLLPPPTTSGFNRVKLPLGSSNKIREPFTENLQRVSEAKKDRGHRRTDSSQHKDMAYMRSSSPENGLKPHVEQKSKGGARAEKSLSHSSRGSQEPRGGQSSSGSQGATHSRRTSASPSRHDHDTESGGGGGGASRSGKAKSTWRPVREALNVDSVLNEMEQRRQQQQQQQQHDSPRHSKPSLSHERAQHTERDRNTETERDYARSSREDRKQKCLMTIYEDEQRHETESHSSLESESRPNNHQRSNNRLKNGPKTLLRSDTWTIQRTESGYESSDRLSSGSTNPDSPGVDGSASKDQRMPPEPQSQSQQQQNRGDTKAGATRSPSHNGKHQHKTQGKNSDQVLHSHLKCSPTSRRKLKYNTGVSRKAGSAEKETPNNADIRNGKSDPHETSNCMRGHNGESATLRAVAKTSSSEWNSSDDLALSEPDDRDSAYRSSNSEAAVTSSDSQGSRPIVHSLGGSGQTAEPTNQRQPAGTAAAASQPHLRSAPLRTSSLSHQGESSRAATFRPRLLQEPFQTSPRPSASRGNNVPYDSPPHRKGDTLSSLSCHRPTGSDGSSKSGSSDPERSTPSSSCDSEERLPGCRPPAGGGGGGVEQAPPGQEVALTTYFNVDNCMTETYRLKYHHQRPLVLSATMVPRTAAVVTEHRDPAHTLPPSADALLSQDVPKNRPDTSHNSNKPTAKWNTVTAKGLDERGFL